MPTPVEAAQTLLARRKARQSLHDWNVQIGNQPAKHHQFINNKLQEIADSFTSRYVIILMPPGAAKSTYASVAFPPWYLGRCPGNTILACSYSYTLAESFGRRARNLVEQYSKLLGYALRSDSQAAGEWESSNGGRYFCAGVGSGIAGHRADLGLIDDYLGNQEDADSKNIRDTQWAWFWNDFYPRLKPRASIVIIANRRHELDLVGMLTDAKNETLPILPEEWEVIRLPFFAEDNDPLGRQPGERLWPEWFTESMAVQIKRLPPRIRSGLYNQRPAPEDGDFFKHDWFQPYEPQDLPKDLRYYAASDHAVSKRDDANKTAMGVFGIDTDGDIWWVDLCWERMDSLQQAEAMLRLNHTYSLMSWYAEKGHITQAIGPFLKKMMLDTNNFINIIEYTPKRDKPTRAQSIRGIMALGRFHVPKFKQWWPDVEAQLLAFPSSSEDDVVDMLGHIGKAIDSLVAADETRLLDEPINSPAITLRSLRIQQRRYLRMQEALN